MINNEKISLTQVWPNAGREFGMVDTRPNPAEAKGMLTAEQRRELDDAIAKAKIKTEAVKFDEGKADWSLIPFEALEEVVKVMEYGKNKYSAHNWSSGTGFKYTRVFNALMRHLLAFMRGEDKDPETGLSHIAHAACNILFMLHFIKFKEKFNTCDDRQVKN